MHNATTNIQGVINGIQGVFQSKNYNQIQCSNHGQYTLAALAMMALKRAMKKQHIDVFHPSAPHDVEHVTTFKFHPRDGGKVQVQLSIDDENNITLEACPYGIFQIGYLQAAREQPQELSFVSQDTEPSQEYPSVLAFNLNYKHRGHRLMKKAAFNSFLMRSIQRQQIQLSSDDELKGYLHVTYRFKTEAAHHNQMFHPHNFQMNVHDNIGGCGDDIFEYDHVSAALYIRGGMTAFVYRNEDSDQYETVDDLSLILDYYSDQIGHDVHDIVAISLSPLRADLPLESDFMDAIRGFLPRDSDQRQNNRCLVELCIEVDTAPNDQKLKVFNKKSTEVLNALKDTERARQFKKLVEYHNSLSNKKLADGTLLRILKGRARRLFTRHPVVGTDKKSYRDFHKSKAIRNALFLRDDVVAKNEELKKYLSDYKLLARSIIDDDNKYLFWENLLSNDWMWVTMANGNVEHDMIVVDRAQSLMFRKELMLRTPSASGLDIEDRWPKWRDQSHDDFKSALKNADFASKRLNDLQGVAPFWTLDDIDIKKCYYSGAEFFYHINDCLVNHGGARKGIFEFDGELLDDEGFVLLQPRPASSQSNTNVHSQPLSGSAPSVPPSLIVPEPPDGTGDQDVPMVCIPTQNYTTILNENIQHSDS